MRKIMTLQSEQCKYCNVITKGSTEVFDTIIEETQNFIVMPSLGSLVEGWLLITPKNHVLNSTQLNVNERLELNDLITKYSNASVNLFEKSVTVFEHGAVYQDSIIGCGIDHAHVHIVPINFDMEAEVKNSESTFFELSDNINIIDFYNNYSEKDNKPYWIFSVNNGPVQFTNTMKHTSQFFRKVIAKAIDSPESYDYKKSTSNKNVISTLIKYKALLSNQTVA